MRRSLPEGYASYSVRCAAIRCPGSADTYTAIICKGMYISNKGDRQMGIKPGPKPIAESTGKKDQRRRVTTENKEKHPDLEVHKHKKGE